MLYPFLCAAGAMLHVPVLYLKTLKSSPFVNLTLFAADSVNPDPDVIDDSDSVQDADMPENDTDTEQPDESSDPDSVSDEDTADCATVGQTVPVVPGAKECCKGLQTASIMEIVYSEYRGYCSPLDGASVCIDCGNSICEEGEDICNCSQDCAEKRNEMCDDGSVILYTPISNYIGKIVYIDWFDVLLLYVEYLLSTAGIKSFISSL